MFMVVIDGGATGCAVSTSISRGCMVLLLGAYLKFSTEHMESFEETQAGFRIFFQKHKHEMMTLLNKINNNDSVPAKIEEDVLPDASSSSDSSGIELADAISSHSDIEDDEDTDTLLNSSGPRRRRDATSVSTLYRTKKNVLLFLSLGVPGGLVLIVELWTFDIATIIVSQIGEIPI